MPWNKLTHYRTLVVSALAIVAGILTITACSTEENPPAGTLALAITPTSINVAQGGSGSSALNITRGGSFTGAVTLSASGNPTGVGITFSPGLIAAGAISAGISVTVDAAVAPGNKVITISAAGTGVPTATGTLTVVVVAGDAGSFVLSPVPTTLTAAVGAAAVTSAVGITRTAPFAGPVALTVSGAPAGVTATMDPTSTAGNSSTLSVSAATGAVNGTYPLVVRGTGAGVADATATVNVTVTGGASAGASFTFSPTPLPLTAGGASNTSAVTIARTGTFAPSGALNLTLSGAPAGMTASVAPNTNVTANTATVTAQATGAVAAGTYNLTLTGVGTGIPNAVGTLPVTVTGGGGGGGSFNLTFCNADAPIWVAQQSGGGTWSRVLPSAGTTYPFTFTSANGGIAFVVPDGTGNDLNIVYGTTAEFTALGGTANLSDCGAKTVNGTVANVGATEIASISLGFSPAQVSSVSPGYPAFVLNNVAEGNLDLVASRADFTTFLANKIIIRHNQNIANNGSLAVLDFDAAEAFNPGTANVTVTGLGSDEASVISSFTGVYGSRTNGTLSLISSYTNASGAQPFAAVPLANLSALELNQLMAFAEVSTNSNAVRSAGVYFRAPANQTVAMGPVINTPTVTKAATAPVVRPRMQLTSQAQYNRLINTSYEQAGLNKDVNVFATAAYYGGLPATWDVTVPDLSGVTGWNNAWGLQDGTPIDWDVSVQGGAIQFLDANSIVDGSTTRMALVSSGSTPLSLRAARASSDKFSIARRLAELLRAQSANPLR